MYKVYAKLNKDNYIEEIESTAFYTEEELVKRGFIKIDQGKDGKIYGHAQPNYLVETMGKPTLGKYNIPNYKYINNEIIELTLREKQAFMPQNFPTEQEKINANLIKENARLKKEIEFIKQKIGE